MTLSSYRPPPSTSAFASSFLLSHDFHPCQAIPFSHSDTLGFNSVTTTTHVDSPRHATTSPMSLLFLDVLRCVKPHCVHLFLLTKAMAPLCRPHPHLDTKPRPPRAPTLPCHASPPRLGQASPRPLHRAPQHRLLVMLRLRPRHVMPPPLSMTRREPWTLTMSYPCSILTEHPDAKPLPLIEHGTATPCSTSVTMTPCSALSSS
jgi:hypothetical protein